MHSAPYGDEQRLRHLWQKSSDAGQLAAKSHAEAVAKVSEGRLAYFDKLSILCGGTIALAVSFVGSRNAHLKAPCLLHVGLVLLVLGMISSVARNWIWQGYYYFATQEPWLKAELKMQEAKTAYLGVAQDAWDINTGQPIDKSDSLEKLRKSSSEMADEISKIGKKAKRRFWWFRLCERAAHTLGLSGMLSLVILALFNF